MLACKQACMHLWIHIDIIQNPDIWTLAPGATNLRFQFKICYCKGLKPWVDVVRWQWDATFGGHPGSMLETSPPKTWKSKKAPVKLYCRANSKSPQRRPFRKSSWARIENYNLAWVPRWGRGVNLSSTPRQRHRFGICVALGNPLKQFLTGCSQGQVIAE